MIDLAATQLIDADPRPSCIFEIGTTLDFGHSKTSFVNEIFRESYENVIAADEHAAKHFTDWTADDELTSNALYWGGLKWTRFDVAGTTRSYRVLSGTLAAVSSDTLANGNGLQGPSDRVPAIGRDKIGQSRKRLRAHMDFINPQLENYLLLIEETNWSEAGLGQSRGGHQSCWKLYD